MARQNKGNAQRKPDSQVSAAGNKKVEWKGYVNYTPNDSDKRQLIEFQSNWDKVMSIWATIETDGYTIKSGYDERNDVHYATMFCQDEKNPNAGWALSQRAPDPLSAIVRVLYVHEICFEGNWGGEHKAGYSDLWA